MDGSPVGRGCRTLMLSVVFKNRALPLTWLVAEGNKGHFSEENHLILIEQVKEIIPEGTEVMFLGDGEFDGIELQTRIESYGRMLLSHILLEVCLPNSQRYYYHSR